MLLERWWRWGTVLRGGLHTITKVGKDPQDHPVQPSTHHQRFSLNHIPQHNIQTFLEHLQGQRLHHLSRQPIPVPDHPFRKVVYPNVYSPGLLGCLFHSLLFHCWKKILSLHLLTAPGCCSWCPLPMGEGCSALPAYSFSTHSFLQTTLYSIQEIVLL